MIGLNNFPGTYNKKNPICKACKQELSDIDLVRAVINYDNSSDEYLDIRHHDCKTNNIELRGEI